MKIQSILALGDSFVTGAELLGPTSTEAKHLAFPNLLGNSLKVPVFNYGWAGGSNQRSLRLLPEKLLQHPHSLVLFFHTEHSRTEYFRPDLPQTLPQDETGYSPIGTPWSHPCIDATTRKINDLYYKEFYHDTSRYNNYREYNMLLTVQVLCERYASDYLHIFGFPGSVHQKVSNQQCVLDQIDCSKILKFPSNTWSDEGWNYGFGNLIEWVQKEKFPVGLTHMLHEGHRALAELILAHLNS